ncbi:MAG: helix-turn-helix transcriptional regulator [Clostridia bacterium]|nr:helix-turn-helix transcriptional regulator [Clostridia bacterium]
MELNNLTSELLDVILLNEHITNHPQATDDMAEHEYIADLTLINAKVPGGLTPDYTHFNIVLKLFGPLEKTIVKPSSLCIKYIAFFKTKKEAQNFDPSKKRSRQTYFNAQRMYSDPRINFTNDINSAVEKYDNEEYLRLSISPGTYANNDLRMLIRGHKLDFNLVSEYKYFKIVYFADYNSLMSVTLNKYASPSVDEVETWFPMKSTAAIKQSFTSLSFRIECESAVIKHKSKSIPVKNGDICLIPQNTEYQHSAQKDERIVFHFNVLNGIDSEIRVFTPQTPAKYKKLFTKAYELWQAKAAGYRYRATAILYEVLSELQADGALIGSNIDSDISRALDMIEKNFKLPGFKIEDLAKELYLSEVYLRQKFKKQLGISPKKYLIKRRIQEAELMLNSKYYSQLEISQKCGFSDVKYFRYAFKEETGKTISEYKHMI